MINNKAINMNTDAEKRQTMGKQTLSIALNHIKEQNNFQDFSEFLTARMGITIYTEKEEEISKRRQAYREFRKRTNREAIASLPTMKRWFGIGGYSVPDREQIYQMCFAMHLTVEESQEYLYFGLHEPAFQVNDYQEVVLVYALYHDYTFAECMDLITELENQINPKLVPVQTRGTQMLLEEFQEHRDLEWNLFMEWMLERAVFFKGYSKTSLNYFAKYKKIILDYVRQDARQELDMLLTETDYEHWCRLHPFLSTEPETRIRKYISSCSRKGTLEKDLHKNIKELSNIAFSHLDPNTSLLAEVFGTTNRNIIKRKSNFSSITTMTQKRLSDLLNIPIQKERYLMVRRALHSLTDADNSLPCPEWIQKMALEYPRNTQTLQTIGDARIWLENYQNENKRRCLQIGRDDLLPLVLYVAQRRYLESIEYDMARYKRASALEQFEQLANSTLAACNMVQLSEKYELDVLLRLCYQNEELYSYSELLEAAHLSLSDQSDQSMTS